MVLDSTYVGSLSWVSRLPIFLHVNFLLLCRTPPPPFHCSEQLSSLYFYFSNFLYITFTHLLTIFHCVLVILKFCILVKNIDKITRQLEVQFLSMNISTIGFTTNLAMQFILIIYLFLIDIKCYYVLFVNLYIFS